MAPDDGATDPAMSDKAWNPPQGLDLFQAISLLERSAPEAEDLGQGSGRGEAVRLAGHISLSFPPADVMEVERTADAPTRWRLVTPVLALAGVNGPLPESDTELLLSRRGRRGRPAFDFLDIFHHRWLSFLYRSRKLHRPGLQWRGPQHSPLSRALDAVSGLGLADTAQGPHGERSWLRHAALLGPAPRSMAQLQALLTDRLGVRVEGEQCVGSWSPLEARETRGLGQRAALGVNAVLGRRAWDSSAGIRLSIGPIPSDQWDDWLPGGRRLALLAWLTQRHAQSDLRLHIVLCPAPEDSRELPRLGSIRLGWSSWLKPARRPASRAPVQLQLASVRA